MRVLGHWRGLVQLGKRLYRKYSIDAVSDSAAAFSYYFIFSVFPFLLFVAALIAYLPLQTSIEQFLGRVRPLVPAQAIALVDAQLRDLTTHARPHLLTFGLLGSFWSASRGMDAVRRALNLAQGVTESRPLWRTELATCAMTLCVAVLLLVAAGVLIASGGLGLSIASKLGIRSGFSAVMRVLRWPALGLTFMTAAGLVYRFLPDIRQDVRSIAPGAAAGGSLWVLTTWGFGEYVAAFGSYHITYGTLGGLMILLTWLYLSGFILLAGGELNAALGHMGITVRRTGDGPAHGRHEAPA